MSSWARLTITTVGFLLLLPVGFLYVLGSQLLAPEPWIPVFWGIWAAFVGAAIYLRKRAWYVLMIPVAAFLFWLLLMNIGDWVLGWTA